ncbi:hypothetical protein [Alteromonas sp. C1M14]|uniref:hypothetical protein n=1 Tax=Alteromonas sp. C1M14 TaxID=2841567 RepID=UPI001C08DBD2|nr:hypothetical protein [Alteromonas sp. C1M14]MBU2978214.1 hypothetical protein [Alteromonas sp. C1M14]
MSNCIFTQTHRKPLSLTTGIVLALALSACTSTEATSPVSAIDHHCITQAQKMSEHAEYSQSPAQHLGAANAMQHCIANPLPAHLSDKDHEQIMQVMAISVLSYLKAGDMDGAAAQLRRFDTQFPGQDLYLPDFTSFRDTATALLAGASLQPQILASLNISRGLRLEIERQQYWLTH